MKKCCRTPAFRKWPQKTGALSRLTRRSSFSSGGGQFTADLFLFAKVSEEESTALQRPTPAIVAFPSEEEEGDGEHRGDADTHGDHDILADTRNQSEISSAVNVSVFTVTGWPNRI